MIAAPDIAPHLMAEPPAIVQPARRTRRDRPTRTDTDSPGSLTAPVLLFVGAIILLDDGTECRVTVIDRTGQAWCEPLPPAEPEAPQ